MSDAQEDKSELGVSDTQAPPATAPAAPHEDLPHTPWAPGHGLCVRFAGRSAVGLVREHNEDNFLVADLTRRTRSLMEGDREQIVGERGTVLGVVLSAVIIGLTEVAFTLINISAQDQQVIFGCLLLLSVVVPNGAEIVARLRARMRRRT